MLLFVIHSDIGTEEKNKMGEYQVICKNSSRRVVRAYNPLNW